MKLPIPLPSYDEVLGRIVSLLEAARRASARSVNTIMTTTYWEIGRRIVEGEQKGSRRAGYGEALIPSLSRDLTARFGRGFSLINLRQMRRFYLGWSGGAIRQTSSVESVSPCCESICNDSSEISQTLSAKSPSPPKKATTRKTPRIAPAKLAAPPHFPLPWSHYVKLLRLEDAEARAFYEAEALRGGWSGPQLQRQVESKFYERTLLSRNKAAMLCRGKKALPSTPR